MDHLDALWASTQGKVQGIRIKAPFDRDYGMRELHIEAPHTNALLFIGQAIEPYKNGTDLAANLAEV